MCCRCLEFLLQNGATASLNDKQGYNPIHYAAAYGHRHCLELVSTHTHTHSLHMGEIVVLLDCNSRRFFFHLLAHHIFTESWNDILGFWCLLLLCRPLFMSEIYKTLQVNPWQTFAVHEWTVSGFWFGLDKNALICVVVICSYWTEMTAYMTNLQMPGARYTLLWVSLSHLIFLFLLFQFFNVTSGLHIHESIL